MPEDDNMDTGVDTVKVLLFILRPEFRVIISDAPPNNDTPATPVAAI